MDENYVYKDAVKVALTEILTRIQANLYRAASTMDPTKIEEEAVHDLYHEVRDIMERLRLIRVMIKDLDDLPGFP